MIKYEVLLAFRISVIFGCLCLCVPRFADELSLFLLRRPRTWGSSQNDSRISKNDSRMPAGWDIKLTGNWRSEGCFWKFSRWRLQTTERHQEFIGQDWKSSRVDGSAWSAGPLMLVSDFCGPFLALPCILSHGVWDCVGIRVVDWRGYIFLEQCAVQRSTTNVYWHSRISRSTMAGCLCNSKTNQISWNAISEVPRTSTERWFQFDNSTSLDWNACFRKKHPVEPWP